MCKQLRSDSDPTRPCKYLRWSLRPIPDRHVQTAALPIPTRSPARVNIFAVAPPDRLTAPANSCASDSNPISPCKYLRWSLRRTPDRLTAYANSCASDSNPISPCKYLRCRSARPAHRICKQLRFRFQPDQPVQISSLVAPPDPRPACANSCASDSNPISPCKYLPDLLTACANSCASDSDSDSDPPLAVQISSLVAPPDPRPACANSCASDSDPVPRPCKYLRWSLRPTGSPHLQTAELRFRPGPPPVQISSLTPPTDRLNSSANSCASNSDPIRANIFADRSVQSPTGICMRNRCAPHSDPIPRLRKHLRRSASSLHTATPRRSTPALPVESSGCQDSWQVSITSESNGS